MLFRRCLLCCLCTFCFSVSWAQTEPLDSAYLAELDSLLQAVEREQREAQIEQVIKQYEEAKLKKEMSFSLAGALPLARGLFISWTDRNYVKQPTRFASMGDKCNWTDYAVAGSPLVVNWALKAAGVKSRSKIERMLTANAMALGLSFGATEVLKHTFHETRPDRSDRFSFPSGHASFAFVSASVLSREYGYISPWITVGGYSAATATQMLRIKHNKHWMNDLYMGAGIGMVSTNFAYFLTDKIFGKSGINSPEVRKRDVMRLMKFNIHPSGFSVVSGTEIGDRSIRLSDVTLKTGAAMTAGVDATCYTSSVFAVEFLARMVDAQMKVYDSEQPFQGDHLNLYHFDLGAKLSTPISLDKRFSTRVFAGTRFIDGATFTDGKTTYAIPHELKFECGCGINFYCLESENYAWGFTCDYFHTFSHYLPNRYNISSVWKILF